MHTAWPEAFHTAPLSFKAIYRIWDSFETLGSVFNVSKSGRPKTSMTEENETLVVMTFVNSPKKFTRRAFQQLSITRISLLRLIDKLKSKLYRSLQVHGLLEDDPDRRCNSANRFVAILLMSKQTL